jgi:SAM-dependent methyltransferase
MDISNLSYSNWNWASADEKESAEWKIPAPEMFYFIHRWRAAGMTACLDLGAGLGRHSILLAANGFKVSALDSNEFGLSEIARQAARENLTIDLKQGDMMNLPYGDSSFDSAVAMHIVTLTDTPGLNRSMAQLRRVMRNGAEVFMTLDSKASRGFATDRMEKIDENSRKLKVFGMDNNTTHCFVDDSMLPGLFAGFEVLDTRHILKKHINNRKVYESNAYYYVLARKR